VRRRRWNFWRRSPSSPKGFLGPRGALAADVRVLPLRVSYEKPTNLAHVRVSISEDTVEQVLEDGAFFRMAGERAPIVQQFCVPPGGIEPPTPGLGNRCSIH
jgi:hypothetical protein